MTFKECGMNVAEAKNLLHGDVHASLFEGHVSCAHTGAAGAVEETPGHPVWTMRQEIGKSTRLNSSPEAL